ncbi:FKBP-type peptidyl-prolyl cis-trans isomerase [Mangrovibacterium lignilyticum]|uniref:FKBP-type peptidyl-prolyl cis-trans isomerase n=1 Tax=Mangrovibacterium lignilyticum TaxID=2668052 RepID=UPI0013D17E20|nr:FKBP-type peptidyl-prolyl cis-trans isomerase [Mangrovibacterium lignilyticum]
MNKLRRSLRNGLLALGMISMVACGNIDDTDEVVYSADQEAEELASLLDEIKADGYDIDTTALGVYYIMEETGDGAYVQPGDSIGITYYGYFTNGQLFDTSASSGDGVWRYVPDDVSVIPGFADAVNQLQVGGSGSFIIPSSLAYGSTGTYGIPPYTTLIFDIELVDIYTVDTEL